MIFKYLTSIVKPCVFKLFSLRKITKSNFYHHLPTLNIANLFMQSFASPPPTPIPHPTKITHHILYHAPQKGRNYRLYPRPFYQKIHRKGATIASPQEKSLLNRLNRCEPQKHPQKWNPCGPKMPTNLREISHPQKQNL